jgi:iron only hydrogenase large subunit-like protein
VKMNDKDKKCTGDRVLCQDSRVDELITSREFLEAFKKQKHHVENSSRMHLENPFKRHHLPDFLKVKYPFDMIDPMVRDEVVRSDKVRPRVLN